MGRVLPSLRALSASPRRLLPYCALLQRYLPDFRLYDEPACKGLPDPSRESERVPKVASLFHVPRRR